MQEELERKSISVTVQATKLTGRVMRAAVAAALRKIEKERTTPKVGRNSMRRLRRRRRTPIRSRLRTGFALLSDTQRNIKSATMWRKTSAFPRLSGPCILRQARLTRLKPLSRNIRKRR